MPWGLENQTRQGAMGLENQTRQGARIVHLDRQGARIVHLDRQGARMCCFFWHPRPVRVPECAVLPS